MYPSVGQLGSLSVQVGIGSVTGMDGSSEELYGVGLCDDDVPSESGPLLGDDEPLSDDVCEDGAVDEDGSVVGTIGVVDSGD